MNDILVSILIPSRDRLSLLNETIYSLVSNARNPEKIEILIRLDFDDFSTLNKITEIKTRLQDKIIIGNRFRGYKDHFIFLNELASVSSGEFLFTWNDDTFMETKNWDDEVLKYSGQFVVLKPEHNMSSLAGFNGNPIYPKKWFEIIGHIALNSQTDNWIHDISTKLGIVKDVNIKIRNEAFHWGGKVNDKTYREGSRFAYDHADYYSKEKSEMRENEYIILKNYIENLNR
jgi:hypothetical protein